MPEVEAELGRLEGLAEAYAAMAYEAPSPGRATGYYSDMKEAFAGAIAFARGAGRTGHVQRLECRLHVLEERFRDQFTGFDQRPTLGRVLPATQWREAQAAERRGDLDTAAAMYQALLDLRDGARELGDIRASAGLALALLRLGQSQAAAAATALRRVVALPEAPPELSAAARRALGELRR
jgi:hypothetical protein